MYLKKTKHIRQFQKDVKLRLLSHLYWQRSWLFISKSTLIFIKANQSHSKYFKTYRSEVSKLTHNGYNILHVKCCILSIIKFRYWNDHQIKDVSRRILYIKFQLLLKFNTCLVLYGVKYMLIYRIFNRYSRVEN